ncbi:hypothetical protein LTS18_011559, partial [Coniosporium uncinatum]
MDYFDQRPQSNRSEGQTVTPGPATTPSQPLYRPSSQSNLAPTQTNPRLRSSTVRIRRLPSSLNPRIPRKPPSSSDNNNNKNNNRRRSNGSDEGPEDSTAQTGRRRSFSEPAARPPAEAPHMPTIVEPPTAGQDADVTNDPATATAAAATAQPAVRPTPGRIRSAYQGLTRIPSRLTGGGRELNEPSEVGSQRQSNAAAHEYDSDIVDYLDVVDPEVSTLSTLTNVQNSLFLPDLGRLYNRRPTYTLTQRPRQEKESESSS